MYESEQAARSHYVHLSIRLPTNLTGESFSRLNSPLHLTTAEAVIWVSLSGAYSSDVCSCGITVQRWRGQINPPAIRRYAVDASKGKKMFTLEKPSKFNHAAPPMAGAGIDAIERQIISPPLPSDQAPLTQKDTNGLPPLSANHNKNANNAKWRRPKHKAKRNQNDPNWGISLGNEDGGGEKCRSPAGRCAGGRRRRRGQSESGPRPRTLGGEAAR